MGKYRAKLGQSRTIPIQGSTPLCTNFGDLERKVSTFTYVGTGMITSTQTFVNEIYLIRKK